MNGVTYASVHQKRQHLSLRGNCDITCAQIQRLGNFAPSNHKINMKPSSKLFQLSSFMFNDSL